MTEKAEALGASNRAGLEEVTGWIGQLVGGRYRVERLIARGGMAVVFLAEDTQLSRQVALKVLVASTHASEADFEERFRREAQALAALSHPNIVTLYDYGETEAGRCYLAMEYISGPRFTDLLKDGPMDPIRAIQLVQQICHALRFAHKRGVIHRDLKPSNLLIQRSDDGNEQVKVVDFGLVKLAETDQSLTQPGIVLGSPHCMAPEQVQGMPTDNRTDIYAVGVLLFRAVTGSFPFHGDSSTATMLAHLHRPIPLFFDVAPNILVPEGLEEIVHRCLSKDPALRYPDMQALLEALAVCSGTVGAQLSSVSMVRPSPPFSKKKATKSSRLPVGLMLAGLGLLSMLGVLLLGWGAYAWWGAPTPVRPEPVLVEPPTKSEDPVSPPEPIKNPETVEPAQSSSNAPPTAEPPKAEPPKTAPKKDPPKAEAPKAEPPKTEPPKTAPKTEPPKTDPPKTEPPAKPPEGYMPLPDDFGK